MTNASRNSKVVIGISLMTIGAAGFLLAACNDESKNQATMGLFSRTICWFGKNSYELYLFHIIVLALMKGMVTPGALGNYTKLFWMALFLGTSALVAGNISTYFSQPMNVTLRQFLFGIRPGKAFSSGLSTENV